MSGSYQSIPAANTIVTNTGNQTIAGSLGVNSLVASFATLTSLFSPNSSGAINTPATNLLIRTGLSTGTAATTVIDFQTSDAVGSGTTYQASTSKMRLTSPGNLLIGTTTDDTNNKIQVNGSIKATQYRLSSLNTLPTSATDIGTTGEIREGLSGGVYYRAICVATNVWVRTAYATW